MNAIGECTNIHLIKKKNPCRNMSNYYGKDALSPFLTHKNVRIMKLVLILLTVMLLKVSATESYAQNKRINLNMANSTVKEVLKGIESRE